MGDTYFCFSDECGDYKPNMAEKQRKVHPFYIRSTLIINSDEWKFLNKEFRLLKVKYEIPLHREVKWANLWSLRHFQTKGKAIPEKHELKFFEHYDYHKLIEFVEETLCLLIKLKEKKIIATFTNNETANYINEKSMLCFHLQEHMQRIEMELQVDEENLGVLFFDPITPEKNELFREIYYDLFENGDFIEKYKFLKDSLNIENSHQSVGIQISDYISGAFSALLKSKIDNNYDRGVKMFFECVFPNLRRSYNGKVEGYGIREVPRNVPLRKWLSTQIEKYKPKQ
jgi:hypothetical protein